MTIKCTPARLVFLHKHLGPENATLPGDGTIALKGLTGEELFDLGGLHDRWLPVWSIKDTKLQNQEAREARKYFKG